MANFCPGVPCRKKPVRSLAPLTLYGHVTGFLWEFDITSGHLWAIMQNLWDDDHMSWGGGTSVHGGRLMPILHWITQPPQGLSSLV